MLRHLTEEPPEPTTDPHVYSFIFDHNKPLQVVDPLELQQLCEDPLSYIDVRTRILDESGENSDDAGYIDLSIYPLQPAKSSERLLYLHTKKNIFALAERAFYGWNLLPIAASAKTPEYSRGQKALPGSSELIDTNFSDRITASIREQNTEGNQPNRQAHILVSKI